MIENVLDVITSVLLLPLQIVLVPIDMLLSNIEGLHTIPTAIQGLVNLVGSLPSTMLSLTGISPIIWNSTFALFLLYITMSPTINLMKAIWAWVRP